MTGSSYASAALKYLIGFVGALSLSILAYFIAVDGQFGLNMTAATLLVLAVMQLVLQLRFFLHLSSHKESLLKTHSLLFTIGTLFIIVAGSLWIMSNLDYRMGMGAEAMDEYMHEQNSKGF